MGVLLKRLEWRSADDPDNQVVNLSPIRDATEITARKGLDVKNNIMNFELKNANSKYVNESGLIRFNEDDAFNLYVKMSEDEADIGSVWYDNDTLIGTYYLKEIEHMSTSNRHRIKITTVDRAYIIFNKVFSRGFGAASDEYWTSPGIFRSVIRSNTFRDSRKYTKPGTDLDENIYFDIDAKFVSEGGKITDYRADVSTTLNGALSDSDTTITLTSTLGFKSEGTIVVGHEHIYYAGVSGNNLTGCVRGIDDTVPGAHLSGANVYQGFPNILFSKVWKPIYEWLSELGQPLNTNYLDEQAPTGILKYDRGFLLWLDKDNEVHFVPTDDTVNTALEVGEDKIYECALQKSVFEAVNMIIYNVGKDMYGAGLNWYWYDENTQTNDLKMRYQPMIDILDLLLNEWILYAESNSITLKAGVENDRLRKFPDTYAVWNDDWSFKADANQWRNLQGESLYETLTSDTQFNNALRDAALWQGRVKAQNITSRVGGLRYKGTITLKGDYYNPGDLISVTDSNTGLKTQLLRVEDVTQTIGKAQWSTTLSVSEDEEALRRNV